MSTRDQGKKKSLRQNEDMFRLLFESVADALFLHDLEGRFLEVNQAACDSLGYTREELLQLPFLRIVKDQDQEALGNLWARVLQGEKLTAQGSHQRRDGATFPVEVHLSPFEYEGRPHILAAARDITSRGEAEKAIQDSVEKHRRLQANIPGMVYVYALHPDGSFSFPYANAVSRELFDVAPDDLMRDGALLAGLIHPDDRERRDQAIRHSADTLQPFREELRHIVNGKVRWYDCMSRPEPQPNGDILWDGIMLEITERKRAEVALAESEQRFSTFMDHLPAAVFIKDQEGRLLFANRCLRETFGWEDCLDKTTAELLSPEMATPMIEDDQRVLTAGPMMIHERITDFQGEEHFFDTYKFPIAAAGAPSLVGGIAVNVTDRHRAEEALRKEKLFTEAIIDSLPGTFFLLDSQGKQMRTNRSEIEITGYSWEELANMQALESIAEEDWPAAQRAMEEVLEKGEASLEAQMLTKDGRKIPFLFKAKKFIIDDMPHILGTGLDITAPKQAEERLLAIQERLELALQGADLGTWDWNVETGEITVNKRWAEMLGYTLAEVEPHLHFWKKLVHPDDLPAVMEVLNAHLEGQTPFYETEYRLRDKLGNWVWVLDKGKVIERDAPGKAVRACGTHLDITARKLAEEALRESEEQIRLALQAANQGLYDLNLQTGEAKVSPEYATMLGYDPGEFQETNARWLERLHPDDRERVAAIYQSYIRGDMPDYAVEFRQRTQSGDWKWILSLGKVLAWDEDGKPLRMLGTHTDITARKQAEEALRESEKRLREAQEMAHLGFWYWNVETGEVTWSDEVYNIFQLDPKEFTPRIDSIMELSPWPEDHERDEELIRKAMESHKKDTFEQRFLLPDQSIGYYYSTFQGKYDDGGNLLFIVGTVLDITARKRAEEERARLEDQMREVQKLESLGVLAGGIAHDFNNLLVAILGNADLALLSLSPASPAYPKVEQIVRASQRAADLCGQMLAYSGKGRFVVGRYDLSEIVQEMAQMLKVSVSKKVALRYFFADDLPAVEVDATQMRQVIMNLITNASEALGGQSGFISVSTGVMDCDRAYLAESYLDDKLPEGEYVYLEVADTGSGIDEETRRRIFDPFFTTKFTGRGLGLAAVLGIVRGHQGAIKVYSEVGQGTAFKVLLPAREWGPGDRGPSAAQSVQLLSRGGTILLVDDDPEVREVGSQMLERLGFKVLTAAHGQEGLKVFQECGGEIDCVILDLTMPEMGGEEVFRELRRLRSNVRVILCSGYNEQEVTQRFAGKGLAGFIQKPYRVANLQEVLNRVFG